MPYDYSSVFYVSFFNLSINLILFKILLPSMKLWSNSAKFACKGYQIYSYQWRALQLLFVIFPRQTDLNRLQLFAVLSHSCQKYNKKMYTLRHYIFWLCPTNSSKNYKHNTADNDTRIKTRNVTTKIFAVYNSKC